MAYDDIDSKYEERKDILFERFKKRYNSASDRRKPHIKKWYDRSLKKINERYKKETDSYIKRDKVKKDIQHKLVMKFKPFKERISIFLERFKKKKEEEKR